MELIFATHNKNKVKEVAALLPSSFQLKSLHDLDLKEEIPETADTIAENAIQKVEYLRDRYEQPIIADDTGLLVSSLNNAPGVHTARYAGEQKNDKDNINLLLKNLEGKGDRSARFITVFAVHIDGCQQIFEGVCEGTILMKSTGDNGFGYDLIFQPDGAEKSFAQMSLEEKNKYSHRAKALSKLIDYLTV
jgi:XTP/dITP diphosphohydrolase